MKFTWIAAKSLVIFFVLAFFLISSSSLLRSQNNNGGDGGDEEDTTSYSGVMINARGVLLRNPSLDYGMLRERQLEAARSAYLQTLSQLPRNLRMKSPIRYVSLNRLEKALVESGGVVGEEMKYLAGLQRIQYVFYFPESKDVVIAGPADAWYPGYEGAMVGANSGLPVCELQDLVVALRAFAPGKDGAEVVGCSIDPTEEGNVRLQAFMDATRGANAAIPANRERFVAGLRQSLGMQTIRVDGVPATTHAAHVMVAADYRMKRIGIGVDSLPEGVRMKTFIDEVSPKSARGNALFRWFFVPDYESVVMTEDRTGMELTGAGVKLIAEDEIVDASGRRSVKAGKGDKASRTFAKSFTEAYPKLAQRSLVFAQLRNFIDMLVCAAHIQKEDFYGKSGWSMEFLGSEDKYPVQVLSAPSHVEAVVGHKLSGGTFMAPIGGGVEIEPELALDDNNVKTEKNNQISEVKNKISIDLQPGQWWWD